MYIITSQFKSHRCITKTKFVSCSQQDTTTRQYYPLKFHFYTLITSNFRSHHLKLSEDNNITRQETQCSQRSHPRQTNSKLGITQQNIGKLHAENWPMPHWSDDTHDIAIHHVTCKCGFTKVKKI